MAAVVKATTPPSTNPGSATVLEHQTIMIYILVTQFEVVAIISMTSHHVHVNLAVDQFFHQSFQNS